MAELKAQQRDALLTILEARFRSNMSRHPESDWGTVAAALRAAPAKLWSLHEMERTGGEPDVVDHDLNGGDIVFFDCSPESPAGRRSLCYDRQGLDSRKQHKPAGSVIDTATAMGVELLNEDEYRALQQLGSFDNKTSSWVRTPADVRKLGGALFCDRRYGHVFTYHNGAQSYYAARGFRGALRLLRQ